MTASVRERNAAVIGPEQGAALRDQQNAPGGTIIDVLGHMPNDLAGHIPSPKAG